MPSLLLLASLSAIFLIIWWQSKLRTRNRPPLPPSPPSDPLIGNVRYLPKKRPELAYINWGKEYKTDILYLNLLGQPLVVLFKLNDAVQLLDKQGAKTSDRPRFDFFFEAGWGETTLTFMSSGPQMRKHRRIFQNALTPSNCLQYREAQIEEARKLVARFLEKPTDWRNHIVTFAMTVVLRIAYGITVTGMDDPFLKLIMSSSDSVGRGGSAGTSMVDLFPIIRKLPQWFTLIPSLKLARDCRAEIIEMQESPFQFVKKGMHLLQEATHEIDVEKGKSKFEITQDDIKGAAGTIFGAGSETTWTTLAFFVLHMIQNPEVQKFAQQEIDSVIGNDRLPNFNDQPNLPYINRVLQETMRLDPATPNGVPHRSSEDMVYKGYFIPKNSLIIGSVRAMNYDPEVYSDPESFKPDRYLPISSGGAGEPFPVSQFGFGRRVCPGAHLGAANLWIVLATIFATVNIGMPKDNQGKEYMPDPEIITGFAR
ncbi:putative O-methylsterigmatocystin oxidoreductase [Tricladium varicosporioides]|nr:putative O-methylsterigmatocystin oxidoreductase [Hymenoscyphus varicosporioides]